MREDLMNNDDGEVTASWQTATENSHGPLPLKQVTPKSRNGM